MERGGAAGAGRGAEREEDLLPALRSGLDRGEVMRRSVGGRTPRSRNSRASGARLRGVRHERRVAHASPNVAHAKFIIRIPDMQFLHYAPRVAVATGARDSFWSFIGPTGCGRFVRARGSALDIEGACSRSGSWPLSMIVSRSMTGLLVGSRPISDTARSPSGRAPLLPGGQSQRPLLPMA